MAGCTMCNMWQPVNEHLSTLGWTSGLACSMEHKHWSMQWVRCAHSAVDYLAAAVGGDRVGGWAVVQKGTVH